MRASERPGRSSPQGEHRPKMRRLRIVPTTLAEARRFVAAHHRHHDPPSGHKFSLGVCVDSGGLVGVAIVGRPVARHLDNGMTAEIIRLATDGTPNACSALLGAAWRAARAMGYQRLITYTHASESGASLRAAGFIRAAELPPRPGWDRPSRARKPRGSEHVARIRWEISRSCRG